MKDLDYSTGIKTSTVWDRDYFKRCIEKVLAWKKRPPMKDFGLLAPKLGYKVRMMRSRKKTPKSRRRF